MEIMEVTWGQEELRPEIQGIVEVECAGPPAPEDILVGTI